MSTSTYGQGQAEWWGLIVMIGVHIYIYSGGVVGPRGGGWLGHIH